eukprot:NODE_197_length_1930_cov_41.433167_g173_i0.p1 GENE.NODE_197_length_1930_cov_41.433167_g173_i0~~NODE_197_length_1930_cov_41.433167_g173_i0.p1  ORF type:complete len:615 (-),score=88.54 NODE_197_length_1930_cov_41.433167_g173_i0:86-1807(-)
MDDLLIMPVQRIPRYIMLLERMFKSTHPLHPDFDTLEAALSKLRGIANYINKKNEEMDNLNKLQEIQSMMNGACPTLPSKDRRFIREGVCVLLNSPERARRHFFLFNDAILCARPGNTLLKLFQDTLQYVWMYPLDKIMVEVLERDELGEEPLTRRHSSGKGTERKGSISSATSLSGVVLVSSAFVMTVTVDGEPERYELGVESEKVRDSWLNAIADAAKDYMKDASITPYRAGILRIYNNTNLNLSAPYQEVYVSMETTRENVIRLALENNNLPHYPSKYRILMVTDMEEVELPDTSCPLAVLNEFKINNPSQSIKFYLDSNPNAAVTPETQDSVELEKLPLKIYHQSSHGSSYKAVMVSEKTTCEEAFDRVFDKFNIEYPKESCYLSLICLNSGVGRRLDADELILTVKRDVVRNYINLSRKNGEWRDETVNVECHLNSSLQTARTNRPEKRTFFFSKPRRKSEPGKRQVYTNYSSTSSDLSRSSLNEEIFNTWSKSATSITEQPEEDEEPEAGEGGKGSIIGKFLKSKSSIYKSSKQKNYLGRFSNDEDGQQQELPTLEEGQQTTEDTPT